MTDQPQRPLDPQEIEAYLLGHLPQERVAVLDTALHDDVAALNQFAQAMQVMSLVRQEFAGQAQYQAANKQEPLLEDFNTLLKELGQQEAAAEPITLPIEQAAFHATPAIQTERMSVGEVLSLSSYVLRKAITSRPAILSAAAAIVLLATALFFNWGGSDNGEEIVKSPTDNIVTTPEAAIVATLTAEQDSQWAEGALAPGSPLHPGDRLTLTAGFAEITTEEGAVVILESPATIELLDNRNALRLHSGKLVGICETPSSKGFLVRTPHMDVTDLGTRFGVDVSQLDATEVHVFEGKVLAESPGAEPVQLFADESVRASADMPTIKAVAYDPERFQTMQRAAGYDSNDRFLTVETDINAIPWLIATAKGSASATYGGNLVNSRIHRDGFQRSVAGGNAYGFIQYQAQSPAPGDSPITTGSWSISNLPAGRYDVATAFAVRAGGQSVRYTVNGLEVFVDQSKLPEPEAGPTFLRNGYAPDPTEIHFATIGSAITVADGGSITITIDNSNNSTGRQIGMDSIAITRRTEIPKD